MNILKFSTDSRGINLLLDIPEDKIADIAESLKKQNVVINKRGRVAVNKDKCIDCGACVSLCPTDALHLASDYRLEFTEDKCIGCLLCFDACPRVAIEESY